MAAFSLLDQLEFYGSYHNNKWNQLIHVIFVPLIWWTAIVFASYTGPLVDFDTSTLTFLPDFVRENLVLNLGFFAFLFYSTYYLTLEFFAALTFDILLFFMYLGANVFRQAYGDDAWKIALGLHVLSWYMQIHPGHMILEGRKPALLDSLFQSLVLAPLFVWLEVLFVFGYRPQLAKELQARVSRNVGKYRAEQKANAKKAQ